MSRKSFVISKSGSCSLENANTKAADDVQSVNNSDI